MNEKLALIMINGIIAVPMLLLAFYLYKGKGGFLIAGYNTLPEEEKAKYDEPALCRFVGKNMFVLTGLMVVWTIAEIFEILWLLIAGIALFVGVVVFMIIYLNTGNRFRKS
ncbi:DUF3784 domain-containing protein [Ureibacillus sp. FSL K6-8385]|uniref:DUF3784 domain-containing protein n=1 Tax=Ureibacillus sp. FSL K6-8385 TaxID=2954684 RepID=UPI003158D0BD